MSRTLSFKLGAIALLILLLLIPLLMIDGLVDERQNLRHQVLQDIARSSSYRQQITGPILVLPYVKTTHEWKTHDKTGERYQQERQQPCGGCGAAPGFPHNLGCATPWG